MTLHARKDAEGISRRNFARLIAAGGSAALFARTGLAFERPAPLPPTPDMPDEKFWRSVRDQFVMPPEMGVMNAANLCPSSAAALDALYTSTKDMDRDPSFQNRRKMGQGKENTRRLLAEFLHVTPEEIIITRNTSEGNNLISNGIELKAGDEVLIFSDNHPSNNVAWKEKAKRFGFTVKQVEQVNPHPGAEYYIDAFTKAITTRTKLLSFTHQTNTVGDVFPAKELCRVAHERGVLSQIDGAQSFGVMAVDLGEIQPDFYTGSSHKWPCGPKETGVLFVNARAHEKIWPTIYSAGRGHVGLSKTFEGFGQRDEPAIIAFGEALKFQQSIGRQVIERRAQELAQALMEGLRKIDGVKLWTNPDPARSMSVVSFQPGNLDGRKLFAALYENDKIGSAPRGGTSRPGLRISPHFYNLHAEVDRAVAAVKRYVATGL